MSITLEIRGEQDAVFRHRRPPVLADIIALTQQYPDELMSLLSRCTGRTQGWLGGVSGLDFIRIGLALLGEGKHFWQMIGSVDLACYLLQHPQRGLDNTRNLS